MASTYSQITQRLNQLTKLVSSGEQERMRRYLGTNKLCLGIKAVERDRVLHQFRHLKTAQMIPILNHLFSSDVYDYFNFAGRLLSQSPELRNKITFVDLKKWISATQGWAEDDAICQSLFDQKVVLGRWADWHKMINEFAIDKNIQLRRASLVLQVKSVKESDNPDLERLAFETIEQLKNEKEILITKAVSWLLRSLVNQNQSTVRQYLGLNRLTLPAIAYRETMRKINTGKK